MDTYIYVGPHIYTDIRIKTHIYRYKDQETQNIVEGSMCMCICTNRYTHACEGVYIYEHEYVWIHIYINMYKCVHMYVYTHIHGVR